MPCVLLFSQKGQISSTISRLSSSVTSSEKPPVVTASGIQSTFASGCHLTLLAPPLGSPTISSPSLMKTGISSHSFSTMRAYCSVTGWPSVSSKCSRDDPRPVHVDPDTLAEPDPGVCCGFGRTRKCRGHESLPPGRISGSSPDYFSDNTL